MGISNKDDITLVEIILLSGIDLMLHHFLNSVKIWD